MAQVKGANSPRNVQGESGSPEGNPAGVPGPSEVLVSGQQYLVRRLSTFDQFEIARKLSPVLSMMALQTDRAKLAQGFPQAFCALTAGLAKEDVEELYRLILGAVLRSQQGQWVPVYVSGQLAFVDIGMADMLNLVWAVLEAHRLVDFFAGGLSVMEGLQR